MESEPLSHAIEQGGQTSAAQKLAASTLDGQRGLSLDETLVGTVGEGALRRGHRLPEVQIFRRGVGIRNCEDQPGCWQEVALFFAQACWTEIGHGPRRS